ncbi:sugar ABC transporter permease, partial [Enterococcus faecalis]
MKGAKRMKKKHGFFQNVSRYEALILMALPGFIWFIFLFY